MIPRSGVKVSRLDDAEIIGDDLSLFLELTDGSVIALCLPIAELIRRGHTIIEAVDAPAFCVGPVLQ